MMRKEVQLTLGMRLPQEDPCESVQKMCRLDECEKLPEYRI